ncbi:NAD-dependent epimerase/dehydratase family protein [Leptospira borgpetersenii]|uniref:3-beta hydroxysteroid dehydrogenase/isomerase family protein n=1 Tax=Leptospira borgpetersenii serovar Javanica str. UI 09931 TaxID=1049767 RepID=A0AAV3JBK5_LEPBO|nr:NAD(P)-dependent oxidoreductase [Leptospira borgpetersenii]AXX17013.1 NAD(P)-dependent oxidoreductase [Leptospira borgpetersenii serovar Ceylonica]EKQ91131.1 3-beta hydroxysteroid dehydrogenase/isomerase family protein [Leptospira borgpetersenii str. UI 09149]EMN59467.1 3-beta hydroxysteroid dehydrogenase/isomerase family protein [Leptospira borgpetersenii serovar Javanica str. MK146]EPG57357.1 3-beta hydroxysteroid dehydrogenase/isomerase family protein [Leptospira borgpetersenii serovar Ja
MNDKGNFIKTVLVTGGSGSLGLVLLPELVKNYRVVCIGRKLSSFPDSIRFHSNFVFYEVDLENDPEFSINEKPEFIIHLAGKVSGQASSLEEYKRGNELSTQKILRFASKSRTTKILFSSSSSVYGFSNQPVTETSVLNGNTFYAISKIECESLVRKSKNPFVILRIASIYGPTSKSFLNKLLKLFQYGILLYSGNPNFKKSMVHSSDVVAIILIILKKWNKASGKIFNVAYPRALSSKEIEILFLKLKPGKNFFRLKFKGLILFLFNLANSLLTNIFKKKINLEYIQESSVVISDLIQKELDFQFKMDFEEGIQSVLNNTI